MEFRTYKITIDDDGRRVDRVARRFLPALSLSGVYKLLRKGLIRVDGKRIAPDYHVSAGSELGISAGLEPCMHEEKSPAATDSGFRPDILLETDDILFINKPCGIPVHGEGGLDGLIPSSARAERSLSFRTGPLHRLDRDTTGLIAFSRSLEGAQWFSAAINDHVFGKYYLGIVRGIMKDEATWKDLAADGKEMVTLACPLAVSPDTAGGTREPLTLARFCIVTGRKHQIRMQGALHGHPLAGDRQYDKNASRGPGKTYFLHAWQLDFGANGLPGIPEKIVAPLPVPFKNLIRDLFGKDALAHIEDGELYWNEHEELQ